MEFLDAYADADGPNDRYRLLREEMTRLRANVVDRLGDGSERTEDYYDPEAVRETIRGLADRVDGDLVVFAANDFGLPLAYRPESMTLERQRGIRDELLAEKYDADNDDLAAVRDELLETHPRVHKAIVAVFEDDGVRYHLPEGSNEETAFLTVREMVGLVDWTSNSFQTDDLSATY